MALVWQVSTFSTLDEINQQLLELMYGDAMPNQAADEVEQKRHYLEDMVYSYDQVMIEPVSVLNLFASLNLEAPLNVDDAQTRFYDSLYTLIKGEQTGAFPGSLPAPEDMYFYTEEEYARWREDFLASDDVLDEQARFWLAHQQSGYRKRMTVYMFYDIEE